MMSRDFVVPDYRDFRKAVDHIPNYKASIVVKTFYLTACRLCELATKASKSDMLTTPYGRFMTWKLVNYDVIGDGKDEDYQRLLLLTIAVAKRKAKKDKQFYKVIALPIERVFEPWTLDIMRYISEKKQPPFKLTRQHLYRLIKRALGDMIPPAYKNPLRHFRLNHLRMEYNLIEPHFHTAIMGWTFKTSFAKMGQIASPQTEYYLHSGWMEYIPKLLKPLEEKLARPRMGRIITS